MSTHSENKLVESKSSGKENSKLMESMYNKEIRRKQKKIKLLAVYNSLHLFAYAVS